MVSSENCFSPSSNANLESQAQESEVYNVPQAYLEKHTSRPYLCGMKEYQQIYDESIRDPYSFWAKQARELLYFDKDFHTTHTGSLTDGDNAWFLGGRLNASFNCIDRHAIKNPNKVAVIFEADEPNQSRKLTYGDLMRQVSQFAGLLKSRGVRKGDTVAIYLPVIAEAIVAIFACARIGAVHSVVFAGFSSNSLRDRILDANSKVVITADEGKRGGKIVNTKRIVDESLKECPGVTSVIVYRHTGGEVPWTPGRDLLWQDEVKKFPRYLAPESLDSEDPLFMLYTSGSTGKPKGLMHTTAGYLLGAAITGKYVLDIHEEDRYFCSGDFGWITGHTYVAYAPLLLGATTIVYEGTPNYPSYSRYWDIIDKHDATHFYTAPTALRLLRRAGDDYIHHELKSLRAIACVGEPIAAEVWKWVYETVGKKRIQVLDTFFQTETGAHILSPLGGITPTKPGSVTLPFFGIEPVILDSFNGKELRGNNVEGVLAVRHPWPSMARSVWGAHERYMDVYLNPYPGYYFTGDGAARDRDGYYWIRGRVDDVVNVSGHRLSTAEIEAGLLEHPKVSEAAVIGISDDLTGQAVSAFVALKPGFTTDSAEMVKQVRKTIGPFAAPKFTFVVEDLPKTRSGKIMRRILRKIASGEEDQLGDTSTLSNPAIVDKIIATVHASKNHASNNLKPVILEKNISAVDTSIKSQPNSIDNINPAVDASNSQPTGTDKIIPAADASNNFLQSNVVDKITPAIDTSNSYLPNGIHV